jgi:hypothetical protein
VVGDGPALLTVKGVGIRALVSVLVFAVGVVVTVRVPFAREVAVAIAVVVPGT